MTRAARTIIVSLVALLSACASEPPEAIANRPDSVVSLALIDRGDGPPELEVLAPADGATVSSPFRVEVQAVNFELAPSGRTRDGEGHWHVLVDQECLAPGTVIPKDETSLHVGSGESEAEFELPPGTHKLCVQAGDGFHVAVNVSDMIEITVTDD